LRVRPLWYWALLKFLGAQQKLLYFFRGSRFGFDVTNLQANLSTRAALEPSHQDNAQSGDNDLRNRHDEKRHETRAARRVPEIHPMPRGDTSRLETFVDPLQTPLGFWRPKNWLIGR